MISYSYRAPSLDDSEQRRIRRTFAERSRVASDSARPSWSLAAPWLGFAILAGGAVLAIGWVVLDVVKLFGGGL